MSINLPNNINVVWQPLQGDYVNGKYVMSSQELALTCPADIIFLSSSRAGGKTEVSLIIFAKYVGLGYGQYFRAVYLDCHYPDLQDVIARSKRLFPMIFGNKAVFHAENGKQRWVFSTGEELWFRIGYKEEDYQGFHGQEFAMILYNELSKQPTDAFYKKMLTTNRTSFDPKKHPYYIDGKIYASTGKEVRCLKNSPNAVAKLLPQLRPRIVITTNPSGAGKAWVKKEFVDPAPAGKIFRKVTLAFNPKTQQKEEMVRTQVHIFTSYKENYHLVPEYVAELENIEDPELRKAWLYGDWDADSGDGMFNDIWRRSIHIVDDFKVPLTWQIYRSFDWGWSKPFSVGWYCVSDGSDLRLNNGNVIKTVRGDVFRFMEFYGCVKGKQNVGLNMFATDVTKEIINIELKTEYYGKVVNGVADSAINSSEDGHSISEEMGKSVKIGSKWYKGITWIMANKKSGSRSVGWQLIRKRLRGSVQKKDEETNIILPREEQGFFVTKSCTEFIRTFPNLQKDMRKKDDVDTNSEDHIADEVRYFINFIDNNSVSQTSIGVL